MASTTKTKSETESTATETPKRSKAPARKHVLYRPDGLSFSDVFVFGEKVAALEAGMSDRTLEYIALEAGQSLAEAIKAARE